MSINNSIPGMQLRRGAVDLTSSTTGSTRSGLNVTGVRSSAIQPETGNTDGGSSSGVRSRIAGFFQRLCSCFNCYRSSGSSTSSSAPSANNSPAGTVNGGFDGVSVDLNYAVLNHPATGSSASSQSRPTPPEDNYSILKNMAANASDGPSTSTGGATPSGSGAQAGGNGPGDITISGWRQRGANVPSQSGSDSSLPEPLYAVVQKKADRSSSSDTSSASSSPRGSISSDSVFGDPQGAAQSADDGAPPPLPPRDYDPVPPQPKPRTVLGFTVKADGGDGGKPAVPPRKAPVPTPRQNKNDGAGASTQQPQLSGAELEKALQEALVGLDEMLYEPPAAPPSSPVGSLRRQPWTGYNTVLLPEPPPNSPTPPMPGPIPRIVFSSRQRTDSRASIDSELAAFLNTQGPVDVDSSRIEAEVMSEDELLRAFEANKAAILEESKLTTLELLTALPKNGKGLIKVDIKSNGTVELEPSQKGKVMFEIGRLVFAPSLEARGKWQLMMTAGQRAPKLNPVKDEVAAKFVGMHILTIDGKEFVFDMDDDGTGTVSRSNLNIGDVRAETKL